MIMCPSATQGLSIQTKHYYNILKDTHNICVFCYKSYYLPHNKNWNIKNIYFSDNIREEIQDRELLNFVKQYNIELCLIPEICFNRIFEITEYLKFLNVKVIAIPNSEIIRTDEINRFNVFNEIWVNNYSTKRLLYNHNIHSQYLGFSIKNNNNFKKTDKITFLAIGGLNAYRRKQFNKVFNSFKKAYEIRKDIQLIMTIQNNNIQEHEATEKIEQCEGIKVIKEHLTYEKIIELYKNSDVFIQVSKTEGLGLGFFESLANNIPVLTLNCSPHNEIINDKNGWITNCYFKENTENDKSFVQHAHFNENDLTTQFLTISKKEIDNKKLYLLKNNNHNTFKNRFLNLITKPKTKKILIMTWYDCIWGIKKCKEEFKKLNYDVHNCPMFKLKENFNTNDIIYEIDTKIDQYKPNIILWWCWNIDYNIIQKTYNKYQNILQLLFNWDDPFCWEDNTTNIDIKSRSFHMAFITSKEKQNYLNNSTLEVYTLYPGYNNDLHTRKIDNKYKCDINFCLTNTYSDSKYKNTVVDRKDIINKLKDKFNIHVYGPEHIGKLFPNIYKGYIDYNDLPKLIYNSKITLNSHVTNKYGYLNERDIITLGSEGLLLTDKIDGFNEIFEEDKDYLTYDSNNIVKKVTDILTNYNKYKQIRLNGKRKVMKNYQYKHFVSNMLNKLENYINSNNEITINDEILLKHKLTNKILLSEINNNNEQTVYSLERLTRDSIFKFETKNKNKTIKNLDYIYIKQDLSNKYLCSNNKHKSEKTNQQRVYLSKNKHEGLWQIIIPGYFNTNISEGVNFILKHCGTNKNLHSHNIRNFNGYEITCFDGKDNGDYWTLINLSNKFKINSNKKKYCIVTQRGYPFGGGEDYLYDTMRLLHKEYDCFWISFYDKSFHEYSDLRFEETEYGLLIKVPLGFQSYILEQLLFKLKPNILNHQGERYLEFINVANKLNIPIINGYHFWGELLDLKHYGNINMIHNINKFNKHHDFDKIIKQSSYTYCASEFMQKIINKVSNINLPVIYPLSVKNKLNQLVDRTNNVKGEYITLINLHEHKGGLLMKYLSENTHLPLLAVHTEHMSDEFYNSLRNIRIVEFTKNICEIYNQTRILITPSIVDETFGRGLYEGLVGGIPVISSNAGNLPNLLDESFDIIDKNNFVEWKNRLERYYNDNKQLFKMSQNSYRRSKEIQNKTDIKFIINRLCK